MELSKVVVNSRFPEYEQIKSWVLNKRFIEFEKESLRMGTHTRKRNVIYSFPFALISNDVIMKVSTIHPNYGFWRKLNLYITALYRDYNYVAYKGGLEFEKANINTGIPIAYWSCNTSVLHKKSYYLYKKVNSDMSVSQLCDAIRVQKKEQAEKYIKIIAERLARIINRIHAAGLRHGDPHGVNFLVKLRAGTETDLSIEDLLDAEYYLIDLDKFNRARIKFPLVKQFFDLRCLRRFTVCGLDQQKMLRFYLSDRYSTVWKIALSFWLRGGFNFFKWHKPQKKRI